MTNQYHIWHPFTQIQASPEPLKVVSGKGVYLKLADGRQILDLISSWWVNIHGHGHKQIADAIHKQALQLEHVLFAGFTHQPAEELASVLCSVLPDSLNHIFFSDDGSTSVEVALKMAQQYWKNLGLAKTKFIGFAGGYHGDTVGAMSIGGSCIFWNNFKEMMFTIDTVEFPCIVSGNIDPTIEEREKKSLKSQLENLLENSNDYAAVCIEPLVQGAGGMRMCRPQFLQALRDLCNKFETLLIFDEVMTGFGRTGSWFACTKSQVTPDIICLSKGITGGFLPLAVTITSAKVYDSFFSQQTEKMFFHGHSYTANPLACAAACASMRLLKENTQAFEKMELLMRSMYAKYLSDLPCLHNSRFCGTIFAVDIKAKDQNNYFSKLTPWLKQEFLEKKLLIRPLGNTIYLLPPYCITPDQLEYAFSNIQSVLEKLPSSHRFG